MDRVHLASLFENATEGIILTKGRGSIVLVNPAAERMFGYSSDKIIGKDIELLIPDRFQGGHLNHRESFNKHPQNRVMGIGRDLFGKKSDQSEFPVEVSLSFYTKDEELYVIAFIVDITQRKNIEMEMRNQKVELEKMAGSLREMNSLLEKKVADRTLILQEALMKLEYAQRETSEALNKEKQLNEIKSRFMSIASHEFRTPLSTVLSSASLISKYTSSEDHLKRERHVERIKNSVRSLNGILEDFLSLGKLEEGKVDIQSASFNLQEFMMGFIDEMQELLKEGQTIAVNQSGDLFIDTDKRILKNVLLNLVTNAIKFSKEGDPIKIELKSEAAILEIKVIDHGIGIPEEEMENLFTSFYRARNAINIQGTGLGLHIVKRYLDLLNGDIRVQSDLGSGSIFTVTIPVSSV